MSTHVSSGFDRVQVLSVSVNDSDVTAALERLNPAIAAYEAESRSPAAGTLLAAARREAAQAVSSLSRRDARLPAVARALEVIRALQEAGVYDEPSAPADAQLANSVLTQGWPGVLAAMLLAPSWQCPAAPLLEKVPDWLWGDYATWLFAAPEGFSETGDAERYAAHILRHLEELARWVSRNLGSAAVQAAGKAYLRFASGIPLYFSSGSLKHHAELRGQVLTRLLARETTPYDPAPFPRTGRRLRVGFVNRHFGPQTETYTTLPTFEQLDPEQFETILFSIRPADTPLAEYCRSRAQEFHVLPDELDGQLAMLRDANLDVVVFGTNVTAVAHEVTRLALYRVAPLQVVNNSSCITSGLPPIDLYVSGTQTESERAPEHFSERLGLLPGPAHAFDYEQDRQEAATTWTREALGIPGDAPLFVTAANYFKITPEMQHAWARLLAAVPGAYLLVHPFNPNWSASYPVKRFSTSFDRVLAAHGVDGDRLVISSMKFPSRSDVKELLRVGDVYLDTYPFGGVNSLVDPLEAGLPVIAWEGVTFRSRMGAALLRSLDLPQLVVSDEASYHSLAARLATDSDYRQSMRSRIAAAMERGAPFLDPLAASDAFGDLIAAAFDELVSVGRDAFRRARAPLIAPGSADSEAALQAGALSLSIGMPADAVGQARAVLRAQPNHAGARTLLGRAYVASGQPDRGVDYLLAAVAQVPTDASIWFDLAFALRAAGRIPNAIQALESALRLDASRVDGWRMMAELADNAGASEIAQEARTVIETLQPESVGQDPGNPIVAPGLFWPAAVPAAADYDYTQPWFKTHESHWNRLLKPWAEQHRPVRALEVGCFEGRSTCWLLQNLLSGDDATITCIDPWPAPEGLPVGNDGSESTYQRFLRNIAASGRATQVTVRRERSDSALPTLPDASFDFIYIDGDHSEAAVYHDSKHALRLLRPGGLLLWDDYYWCEDVRRGVDRACAEQGLAIDSFGANAAYAKPSAS